MKMLHEADSSGESGVDGKTKLDSQWIGRKITKALT
jgi:hypothetical protein